MGNYKKLELRAKEWLINKVDKEMTWIDFEIINTNDIVVDDCKKTVFFKFQCKYTCMLNCWPKNVDKELYAMYHLETDEFSGILF